MKERTFIEQGLRKVELDRYLAKELDKAGFTKSEIVKTPLVTRIVVNVTRPGLAIGKSGVTITQLTETIAKRFKIDNPQLEIREIQNPSLDAKAVCNKMRATIERGFAWRSVVFKTMMEIRHAGAMGVEVIVSGKITGKAGRKRKLRYFYGLIKKVGEQAKLVDYAKTTAYPKVGAIGIKVRIIRPNTKFPDKVKIKDYIKKEEKQEAAEAVIEGMEETKGETVAKVEVAVLKTESVVMKAEKAVAKAEGLVVKEVVVKIENVAVKPEVKTNAAVAGKKKEEKTAQEGKPKVRKEHSMQEKKEGRKTEAKADEKKEMDRAEAKKKEENDEKKRVKTTVKAPEKKEAAKAEAKKEEAEAKQTPK